MLEQGNRNSSSEKDLYCKNVYCASVVLGYRAHIRLALRHEFIYAVMWISNIQQACKSTCSQISDMTKPEDGDSEEDLKKRPSVEVRLCYLFTVTKTEKQKILVHEVNGCFQFFLFSDGFFLVASLVSYTFIRVCVCVY